MLNFIPVSQFHFMLTYCLWVAAWHHWRQS